MSERASERGCEKEATLKMIIPDSAVELKSRFSFLLAFVCKMMRFIFAFCLITVVKASLPNACFHVTEEIQSHISMLGRVEMSADVNVHFSRRFGDWMQHLLYSEKVLEPLCRELEATNPRLLMREVFLARDLWRLGDDLHSLTNTLQRQLDLDSTMSVKFNLMDLVVRVVTTLTRLNQLSICKKRQKNIESCHVTPFFYFFLVYLANIPPCPPCNCTSSTTPSPTPPPSFTGKSSFKCDEFYLS